METARRLGGLLRERGDHAAIRRYKSLAALQRWARTCRAEFTHLLCVGGDATQSATAAAAVRLDVPFVPVPTGFGNLFARTFEHPRHPEEVVTLLDEGELTRVDVGMVGDDEVFLSHHSYGMLQDIQDAVERRRELLPRSRLARYLAYYARTRRWLADGGRATLRAEVDGATVSDDAGIVTVANVETYRRFLSLTPLASPLDGLLDVFVAPRTSNRHLTLRMLRLMLHLPGRSEGMLLLRGRRVVVTVDDRPSEVLRAAPGALPLLVPRGSVRRHLRRVGAEQTPLVPLAERVG